MLRLSEAGLAEVELLAWPSLSLWLTPDQSRGPCPPSSTCGTDTDNRCQPPYRARCRTPPCRGRRLSTGRWVYQRKTHAHTQQRIMIYTCTYSGHSGQDTWVANIHEWQQKSLRSAGWINKTCHRPNGFDPMRSPLNWRWCLRWSFLLSGLKRAYFFLLPR